MPNTPCFWPFRLILDPDKKGGAGPPWPGGRHVVGGPAGTPGRKPGPRAPLACHGLPCSTLFVWVLLYIWFVWFTMFYPFLFYPFCLYPNLFIHIRFPVIYYVFYLVSDRCKPFLTTPNTFKMNTI